MQLCLRRNSIRGNALRVTVYLVNCDLSKMAVLGSSDGDVIPWGRNCRHNPDIHQSRPYKKPMQR